jgi:hypothetical protein
MKAKTPKTIEDLSSGLFDLEEPICKARNYAEAMRMIEFPGPGTSPEDRSEDEIHAEAFRDIGDCVCMGHIASECMANAKCDNEKLAFAVFHLTEMILNLDKHYKAALEGEMPLRIV